MIDEALIEKQLIRDEGDILTPYKDEKGIWTVGVGHNLKANGLPTYLFPDCPDTSYPACVKWLQKRGGLTHTENDALFDDDLKAVIAWMSHYNWFEPLDAARTAAIVDMGFNLGEQGYSAFTTFNRLMAAGDYQAAADDLKTTKVYTELPKRYGRIAQTIATGQIV